MSPAAVRLGHALRGDPDDAPVAEAVAIACGLRSLSARQPLDTHAVDVTEQALGVDPAARPIYAYLGDLNPALGTVGLVVERSWCRAITGVTRCDSGGLGGRRGRFGVLTEAEAIAALRDLTFAGAELPRWEPAFAAEVDGSYGSARSYVAGDEPDVTDWTDVRAACISRAEVPRDRRLWTWEARLGASPGADDIAALVLSPSAAMVFHDLIDRDPTLAVPERVKILMGEVDAAGVHFRTPRVRAALAGEV